MDPGVVNQRNHVLVKIFILFILYHYLSFIIYYPGVVNQRNHVLVVKIFIIILRYICIDM